MEDNNVCITQLGTEDFNWFDLECDDWDSVMEAFDDEDAEHEYIVSDAEGPFAPIMKSLTPHMTFEVAAELYKGQDCNLAAYVCQVVGDHYYLQNRDAVARQCRDAYCGEWKSAEDYVYEFYNDTGALSELDELLKSHIDWEGVARDLGVDAHHFVELDDGNVAVWYQQ
jgi:Antirestriction protein